MEIRPAHGEPDRHAEIRAGLSLSSLGPNAGSAESAIRGADPMGNRVAGDRDVKNDSFTEDKRVLTELADVYAVDDRD